MTRFEINSSGILPYQLISRALEAGAIISERPLDVDQIQPASLDLRLGSKAYRVRASFLPGPNASVEDKLQRHKMHEVDLSDGAVLETGCVYIVPLLEALALPDNLSASANPKSSTGRLDVFTRVIVDYGLEFDQVPAGYHGCLFAEISPRTFPILVHTGSRLSQIRFRSGQTLLDDAALRELHNTVGLIDDAVPRIADGLTISIDLNPPNSGGIIGYRAKRHTDVIDVDKKDICSIQDFWEPVLPGSDNSHLVLDPNEFYILVSREAVHVPPMTAAEMVAYDPLVGEFRVHYAGFFDPGFGHAASGGSGSRAVLEVRSHDVPFIVDNGQIVGRLVYEHMLEQPETLYGIAMGSNYQAQGLKLSKHFKAT